MAYVWMLLFRLFNRFGLCWIQILNRKTAARRGRNTVADRQQSATSKIFREPLLQSLLCQLLPLTKRHGYLNRGSSRHEHPIICGPLRAPKSQRTDQRERKPKEADNRKYRSRHNGSPYTKCLSPEARVLDETALPDSIDSDLRLGVGPASCSAADAFSASRSWLFLGGASWLVLSLLGPTWASLGRWFLSDLLLLCGGFLL